MRVQVLPLRVQIVIGCYLLLIVPIRIGWRRGGALSAALTLHASPAESNAVVNVDSNRGVQPMFRDELFC